jgi:hypothetical protein
VTPARAPTGGDDAYGDDGKDIADFSGATGPLTVSLDDAPGGVGRQRRRGREGQLPLRHRGPVGGAGGMTLIGSDGPNTITGGPATTCSTDAAARTS